MPQLQKLIQAESIESVIFPIYLNLSYCTGFISAVSGYVWGIVSLNIVSGYV